MTRSPEITRDGLEMTRSREITRDGLEMTRSPGMARAGLEMTESLEITRGGLEMTWSLARQLEAVSCYFTQNQQFPQSKLVRKGAVVLQANGTARRGAGLA